MRIPGINRLKRTVYQLKSRFERKALILLYHRVTELRSDPWSLAVTPSHFTEHLEVLRQHTRPMRLQQLAQALLDRDLPHRSVVITFDDGYADNLYTAKPLLERYDIPATVFLVTGAIGSQREFWWDELDRLLLQPGVLPEQLCLNLKGTTLRWELGEASYYSEHVSRQHSHWRAWEKSPSSRHSLYCSLYELLQPLHQSERRKVVDELLEWASMDQVCRPTHRILSLEEMLALTQGELIDAGAHTVTHSALSALPPVLQREEIARSKAQLEELLNHPVTSFA